MKYFNCSKFFFLIFKHDQIKHLFQLVAAEYFYHVSLGGARLPVSSSSSAFGMSAEAHTTVSPYSQTRIHMLQLKKISRSKAQIGSRNLNIHIQNVIPKNLACYLSSPAQKLPKRSILNFLSYHFERGQSLVLQLSHSTIQ